MGIMGRTVSSPDTIATRTRASTGCARLRMTVGIAASVRWERVESTARLTFWTSAGRVRAIGERPVRTSWAISSASVRPSGQGRRAICTTRCTKAGSRVRARRRWAF
uniref:(northern house mosquito) hypothetical protein n=1 Tax=Culex pipiens TaxID=7175 RepID=A0A8D8F3G9_CULPI